MNDFEHSELPDLEDDDGDDGVCEDCDGTGEGPTEFESCWSCGGSGVA